MLIGSLPSPTARARHGFLYADASSLADVDCFRHRQLVLSPDGGWRIQPLSWCFWLFRLRSRNLSASGRQSGGKTVSLHPADPVTTCEAISNVYLTAEHDIHADVPLQVVVLSLMSLSLPLAAVPTFFAGLAMTLSSWHSHTPEGCRLWSTLWYSSAAAMIQHDLPRVRIIFSLVRH